jgi:glycosyltransferase involved in cell wall biosynthesis
VAIVVNNLDVGGLEKVALSLLRKLDNDKVQPFLVCLEGPGKMFPDQPLPLSQTLVLQKKPRKIGPVSIDVGLLLSLRNWLRKHRIDVVHAHNFAPLFYAGLASRLAWGPIGGRPRVVYTEHNQVYSASESTMRLFRRYIGLADHVVAVSKDLMSTLQGPKVGVRDNISVIYNGIDGTRFQDSNGDAVRRELEVEPGEILVGTGIVLSKQKGIGNLVQAAGRLVSELPSLRFVVAGDGPLRQELEAQAAALGLGGRFRFLGYRSDMQRLIAAFDIYVLPSLWEGLPLALLEAMAMRKFIVCTSVGGNTEIVQDGENGLVVAPGDVDALTAALRRAANESELRARAKQLNREKFDKMFSEPAMIQAHENLYLRFA